jgi:hypothetical protein
MKGVLSCGLWPPCSPDITLYDFFMWEYLKDEVYRTSPCMKEEMRENIQLGIALYT